MKLDLMQQEKEKLHKTIVDSVGKFGVTVSITGKSEAEKKSLQQKKRRKRTAIEPSTPGFVGKLDSL